MKRRDLEKHLREHGCEVIREGGRHTIWRNPTTGEIRPVPRHNEIKETTARAICKGLGVPQP